tara:strand:+ start:11741 stop:12838 length:1098 start_codon:yes stop_codon:yes gene_type:complete
MVHEETDATREGTAAHWVAERILASYRPDMPIIISEDLIGQPAPNGVIVTEEMWDGAHLYTNEILQTCNLRGLLNELHIEERVTMPEIHEHCWGTPDCWAFDATTLTLYIWDFKFGHSSVNAFQNWQLICYIQGIMNQITPTLPPKTAHNVVVVASIVQPRCFDGQGPVRKWEEYAVNMNSLIGQLHHAAHAAMSLSTTCSTGPHCKNCEGRAHCPALRESAARVIDHSCDAIPQPLTDVGLAYELEKLTAAEERLKARRSALEVDAEHRIRSGVTVPGLALEQSYGRDKWLMKDADLIIVTQMMGVDVVAPVSLLTPSQVKTLLKKNNVGPSAIDGLYAKPPTSMKLVVDDGSKAKRIFAKGAL